jgi:hypothetical protein
MMKKAATEKNAMALEIAADWIGEVESAEERAWLTQQFEAFKAEIAGGAKS